MVWLYQDVFFFWINTCWARDSDGHGKFSARFLAQAKSIDFDTLSSGAEGVEEEGGQVQVSMIFYLGLVAHSKVQLEPPGKPSSPI